MVDEAYTRGTFASHPVTAIVTDYSEPNNHIGYTLLLHPLADIQDDSVIFRLPSFLTSTTTLILVFLLVGVIVGRNAAVCATLLLGTNQVFLNFAAQVRGQSVNADDHNVWPAWPWPTAAVRNTIRIPDGVANSGLRFQPTQLPDLLPQAGVEHYTPNQTRADAEIDIHTQAGVDVTQIALCHSSLITTVSHI